MGKVEYAFIRLMDDRGISQSDLSEMTGIPTSTMNRYMNGQDIPASKLKAIASALGVSVDDVLGLSIRLSNDERELLAAYRALDQTGKTAVLQLASTLSGARSLNDDIGGDV